MAAVLVQTMAGCLRAPLTLGWLSTLQAHVHVREPQALGGTLARRNQVSRLVAVLLMPRLVVLELLLLLLLLLVQTTLRVSLSSSSRSLVRRASAFPAWPPFVRRSPRRAEQFRDLQARQEREKPEGSEAGVEKQRRKCGSVLRASGARAWAERGVRVR